MKTKSILNPFYLLFVVPFLLHACKNGNNKNTVELKKDDSFDTAHVAVAYVPSDHQDSLRKALQVEYRWLVHERNKDSTVELYNTDGKITASLTYNEWGRLQRESIYAYNALGALTEIKEKEEGKLLYKRIFLRDDTLKTAEYYLDMTDHDTIGHKKFVYNEKQKLVEMHDISSPVEVYITRYEYWPNGLLRKEMFYSNKDSLTGYFYYRYNHKGHLREMQGTNSGSYAYEKRLYNDKGGLSERMPSISFMGVGADESFIYNYNDKHLLRRVGYIKYIKGPAKPGEVLAQSAGQSEVTYIKYKYRNEPKELK